MTSIFSAITLQMTKLNQTLMKNQINALSRKCLARKLNHEFRVLIIFIYSNVSFYSKPSILCHSSNQNNTHIYYFYYVSESFKILDIS